jgi:FixJ family two-component response regulator
MEEGLPGPSRRLLRTIPLTPAESMNQDSHALSATQGAPAIVIVDDDRENLQAMTLMIEALGYRPLTFDDPRSALAAIRSGLRTSLVITDYRMPGMDGLQFVEALRGMGNTAPVIMLTAHGSIDAYFKSFSLGVFDFVNKPVRDTELRRIIMTALEGHGSTALRTR